MENVTKNQWKIMHLDSKQELLDFQFTAKAI